MVLRAVAVGSLCVSTALAGCVRQDVTPPPTVILVDPVHAVASAAAGPAELGTAKTPPATSFVSREEVDVLWRGAWWPAIVLEKRGERFLVHYDGYGPEWDEVVALSRIRERRATPDIDESNDTQDEPAP